MQETWGVIIGAVLTLVIFSYLLGDNILYRWALALLVGSAVGYALGVAVNYVRQWVVEGLGQQDTTVNVAYAVPLLLGVLLLLKGFSPSRFLGRISVIGNLSLGYLVGVGAALGISGALLGTLIPQVRATGQAGQAGGGLTGIAQGLIVAVGAVFTLLYFTHRPRPASATSEPSSWFWRSVRVVGGAFLVFALGTVFAGAITSGLTALVLRLSLVAELLRPLLGP